MPRVEATEMTQAAYARHRGVSGVAVNKAVREKRISLLPNGKIDAQVADVQWARNSRVRANNKRPDFADSLPKSTDNFAHGDRDPKPNLNFAADDLAAKPVPVALMASGSGSHSAKVLEKPGDQDYWVSRSKREAADAELAEISLAEKRLQVLSTDAIKKIWSQRMSQARETLLQVRSRLAPLLANETDIRKINDLLTLEHDAALRAFAGAESVDSAQVSEIKTAVTIDSSAGADIISVADNMIKPSECVE